MPPQSCHLTTLAAASQEPSFIELDPPALGPRLLLEHQLCCSVALVLQGSRGVHRLAEIRKCDETYSRRERPEVQSTVPGTITLPVYTFYNIV